MAGLVRPSPSDDVLPSPEEIRREVAHLRASPTFATAPSLGRLLSHLVAETLAGRAGDLKEYALGVDVFDRGAAFDPRADTIVRAQARRLRQRLGAYYSGDGRDDPVVIALPKGRYVPTFRVNVAAALWAERVHGLLPAPRTALIGRDLELARLAELLSRDAVRLVTLTGAGGSGKTRLALAVAHHLGDAFPGGIRFVPFASIADPSTVPSVIAPVLGLRHTQEMSLIEALQAHVHRTVRAKTLLVLDNFEHLQAATSVLATLLESSAALTMLVTSRAVLNLHGEHDVPVPPLEAPSRSDALTPTDLAKVPSVALFVQCATAAHQAFELTSENAGAVAGICIRLDGLPLAIELAAALANVLTPAGILERLDRPLELLTHSASDVPDRQRTLRQTLDWSHALLNAPEQRLFRRLAVFAGGCTLESAEAVCNTQCDLGTDTLGGLVSLVGKSLLAQVTDGTDLRFGMLQTVREYGLEQLEASGESEITKRAHAAYGMVIAEEGLGPLPEPERLEWLARCDREHDNFRAALDYLVAGNHGEWAIRTAIGLYGFWERREYLAEGRQRMLTVLAMESAAGRTRARARLMSYLASLMSQQRDLAVARQLHQDALEIYRSLGDQRGTAAMLNAFGAVARLRGDWVEARPWMEESLRICRELGDRRETAAALSNLAAVLRLAGEWAAARASLHEAQTIFQELKDPVGAAWSINHLGDVARDAGETADAERCYRDGLAAFEAIGDQWGIARSFADLGRLVEQREDLVTAHQMLEHALRLFRQLQHTRGLAYVLDGFACIAARRRDATRAYTLAGAADALRHAVGREMSPRENTSRDRMLQSLCAHVDPIAVESLRAAGWRMPLDAVLRMATDGSPPGSGAPTES